MREHQHLFLIGPTGIGKTWLARAFGQKACRDSYTALFRNLATDRADGSHSKLLYQLGRVDRLIVDDFSMAPMSDAERRDFLEICDTRYQARSTLLTFQLPVANWEVSSVELASGVTCKLQFLFFVPALRPDDAEWFAAHPGAAGEVGEIDRAAAVGD